MLSSSTLSEDFNDIDEELAKDNKLKPETIKSIVEFKKDDEDTQYDRKSIINDRIRKLQFKLQDNKSVNQLADVLKIKPKVIISFIKSYAKINDFLIKIYQPDRRNKNITANQENIVIERVIDRKSTTRGLLRTNTKRKT